jgi:hypothetical protein
MLLIQQIFIALHQNNQENKEKKTPALKELTWWWWVGPGGAVMTQ